MRRRLVSAWISTVISLSLVLLLVGVGTLLLVNAKAVTDYFKENMQVSVLLKERGRPCVRVKDIGPSGRTRYAFCIKGRGR